MQRATDLVEIRHRSDVHQVDDGKVLHLLGDRVQRLVHRHALGIPVMSEPDDDDTILFGFDGLVDVPAGR